MIPFPRWGVTSGHHLEHGYRPGGPSSGAPSSFTASEGHPAAQLLLVGSPPHPPATERREPRILNASEASVAPSPLALLAPRESS